MNLLPRRIKATFRDGAIHRWWNRKKDESVVREWERCGRPNPPPQSFKRIRLRGIAKANNLSTFVETGTNYGDTVSTVLDCFKHIYSIELFDSLFLHSRQRFARFSHVKVLQGNSSELLPGVLERCNVPALFWLDAHYSGDGTARADIDTPIVQELRSISNHHVKEHAILIDDARCFDGTNSYPTISFVRRYAEDNWPKHEFSVKDDMIQILLPQHLTTK